MKAPDIKSMYREMGAACAGRLDCLVCGHSQPCPADRAADYMRNGWPKCCDRQMRLVTNAEIAKEPKP